MRLCRIVLIVAGLSLVLPLPAAEPQAGEHVPPVSAMMQNLVSQSMRLGVVSGRVVTTIPWRFGTGTHTSNVNKERITFKGLPGGPSSLSYEATTPQEHFSMDISGEGKFTFRREGNTTATFTPVEFTQTPDAPLVLAVGEGAARKEYRGKTLWHLWIAQPEECRRYMVPVLETVRPQGALAQTEASIENQLLQIANVGKQPERKHWSELVAQLGNDRFTRREAADRDLRSIGSPVLPFLEQLDQRDLDAEQQFRLRRIMVSLTKHSVGDVPELTAAWLAEDPQVWLSLLTRANVVERRAAATALERLLHGPIPVDPAADPATQKTQFEKLRTRIDNLKSADKQPSA